MADNKLIAFSLAAAVAGGVALSAGPAAAQQAIKCYGIAKAGQNDCANKAGTHACAGHAKEDFDGGEWKGVLNKEECAKLRGSVEPFDGPNPKMFASAPPAESTEAAAPAPAPAAEKPAKKKKTN